MRGRSRALALVAVAIAVATVLFLKQGEESGASAPAAAVATELPRLIDLGADRCVPCKMMAPILEELRADLAGQCEVQFIDVWKNPDEGPKYGIKMIPTQIFLGADGTELFRHEGFFSREEILATFAEHGYRFSGVES